MLSCRRGAVRGCGRVAEPTAVAIQTLIRPTPACSSSSASTPTTSYPSLKHFYHRRRHPSRRPTPARAFPSASSSASPNPPTSAPILEPSRLISALEKLAAAGHTPEPHWIDMFLAAVQPALPSLSLAQMGSLVRSLARLQVEPPETWVEALLQASEEAMYSAAAATAAAAARPNGGAAADLLTWAAADGRVVPEAGWVGAALQQIQIHMTAAATGSGPSSSSSPSSGLPLSPIQAADVAWAVARLGYRPADGVLDCLAAATLGGDRMPGAGGGSGGSGGGGGGSGGAALASLPPEQLAKLAWAFSSYNYFPPDDWVQAYWLEGIWRRSLGPEAATAVLWSLGCMQLPAEGLWLQNYYLATTGRLGEVPLEGLVNALWALAACREVALAAPPSSTAEGGGAASSQQQEQQSANGSGTAPVPGGNPSGREERQQEKQDDEKQDEKERQEYDEAMATQMRRQLSSLLEQLQLTPGGGTAAQRTAAAQLRAAIERRFVRTGGGSGDGGNSTNWDNGDNDRGSSSSGGRGEAVAYNGLVPAAWAAEWYDATLPYVDRMDRPLLVKALWATAALEMVPRAEWLQRLLAAATAQLRSGGLEPMELLYFSRSADALLAVLRAAAKAVKITASTTPGSLGAATTTSTNTIHAASSGASPSSSSRTLGDGAQGPVAGQEGITAAAQKSAEEEAELELEEWHLELEESREALAGFAGSCFQALSRQPLPPNWRRLNPRFPPYAQPKPGAAGAAGVEEGREAGRVGAAAEQQRLRADGQGRGRVMGPVVPGAGLLQPFSQ